MEPAHVAAGVQDLRGALLHQVHEALARGHGRRHGDNLVAGSHRYLGEGGEGQSSESEGVGEPGRGGNAAPVPSTPQVCFACVGMLSDMSLRVKDSWVVGALDPTC